MLNHEQRAVHITVNFMVGMNMNLITQIVVKTNKKLEEVDVYNDIQRQCRLLKMSRRAIVVEIHKEIYGFSGKLKWPDGSDYKKPICIYTEFDLENRWYTDFLKINSDGKPASRSCKYNRIRLLDILLQIKASKS